MSGLFDTFTISKRGLSVQNGNINTAAHNIANASTEGYSRQTTVVTTTRAFGGTSKFDCSVAGQIGTGAQITTIQRIRNEFVDYQVREANGILGNSEIKSEYLSKIEDILGETSDTGIQGMLSDFYSSLQSLTTGSSSTNVKTVLLQNALTLTNNLNSIYNSLETQLNNAQEQIGTDVVEINGYLDRINELNKQISRMTALGQSPNDLMDSRDLLLDEISSKFGINIDKKALNTIDLNSNEYSNLNLVNSDPNDTNYNRFSSVKSVEISDAVDGKYTMTVEYYANGDTTSSASKFTISSTSKSDLESLQSELEQCRILIADKDGNVNIADGLTMQEDGTFKNSDNKTVDINGKLIDSKGYYIDSSGNYVDADGNSVDEADKVLTTSETNINQIIFNTSEYKSGINNVPASTDKIKGEIAGAQAVQDSIQGYMDELDKLAASLAYAINAIQTGTTDSDLTDAASQYLIFTNGSTTNSDDNISAKNITINKTLLDNADLVNCKAADESGSGANERAQAMAALNTIKFDFGSITSNSSEWTRESFLSAAKVGFDGEESSDSEENVALAGNTSGSTMGVYYAGIITKVGSDSKSASEVVDNQSSILTSLENQKLSESGVSLDEEMTDLIQFQHAYQANAKMISTINDLLDVVINGLI